MDAQYQSGFDHTIARASTSSAWLDPMMMSSGCGQRKNEIRQVVDDFLLSLLYFNNIRDEVDFCQNCTKGSQI